MRAITTKSTRLRGRGESDLVGQSMECANVFTPALSSVLLVQPREAWMDPCTVFVRIFGQIFRSVSSTTLVLLPGVCSALGGREGVWAGEWRGNGGMAEAKPAHRSRCGPIAAFHEESGRLKMGSLGCEVKWEHSNRPEHEAPGKKGVPAEGCASYLAIRIQEQCGQNWETANDILGWSGPVAQVDRATVS